MPPQHVPTEDSPSGAFARRLLRWIGPALQAPARSVNAALFLGLGDALAGGRATVQRALDEAFADTALATLDTWERALGLPVREGADPGFRRQIVLARLRAAFRGSPADLLRMLRTFAGEATLFEVLERAVRATDPRAVFRFVVLVGGGTFDDAPRVAEMHARLQQQAPAHTGWSMGVSTAQPALQRFRCTHRDSRCDRTLLRF